MTTFTSPQKAEQLTDAFRLFNQLSQNLSNSYQGLEEQVEKLHQELAAARSERVKTLLENEKLAVRLQQILAALPAAIIILDAQSRVLDCNTQAINFLGEPLIGQLWGEIAARSLIAVLDNPLERQLLNGLRVTVARSALPDTQEQVVVLSDVSEMNTLQETLNQQKHLSAMGEMVASMAHQVRTPLSTAILYASQLSNPAVAMDKRDKFSKKILERLHYLERQVNDMLVFAKEGRLAMAGFSLQSLLAKVERALADSVIEGQVQLTIDNQCTVDAMHGNEHALQGIIMNLLSNSVEAMQGKGLLYLKVVRHNKQAIMLSIKDSGSGIEAVHLQRIFEPFFTTRVNGTGLGLAVVDSVVKAHGGSVQCYSQLGSGTEFKIILPCISSVFEPSLSMGASA
ncbi:MAG: two-component system, sensor histidine kinase FlrB [Methyloprofundus sp.]|nr:MAG: two-component system, sensor histidine kinase FlrB [Methyloprofundus sp.]